MFPTIAGSADCNALRTFGHNASHGNFDLSPFRLSQRLIWHSHTLKKLEPINVKLENPASSSIGSEHFLHSFRSPSFRLLIAVSYENKNFWWKPHTLFSIRQHIYVSTYTKKQLMQAVLLPYCCQKLITGWRYRQRNRQCCYFGSWKLTRKRSKILTRVSYRWLLVIKIPDSSSAVYSATLTLFPL